MDTPVLSPGRKRDHEGNPVTSERTPDSMKMHAMPNDARSSQRAASPALSTTSSTLSDLSTMDSRSQQPANSTGSPSKKRKLTFAEREVEKAVRRTEQERKARVKLEEKERREEEKRGRDEEKRRKAELREAEKKKKEIEKGRKEEEKKRKEDEKEAEKLKKERAQMRIGAFFGRPAPASTPPSTPDDVSSRISSRRSSVASIDMTAPVLETKPIGNQSEYSRWILPFFPHDHTEVAPHNRFLTSGSSTLSCIDLPTQYPSATSQPLNQRFSRPRQKVRSVVPVKSLVNLMTGSRQDPADLTAESVVEEAALLLSKTSYKILSFCQDVRPPYQGTYTRPVSPRSSKKLSRNPTTRALPDTNYDYDSEAEWQAAEEGDEDLDDDDEMSEDEADPDEMMDFLDDENDTSKRKLMTTDVEPENTGLCWEGETDLDGVSIDMRSYRLDVLHDDTRLPIDPYSSNHWSLVGKTTPLKPKPVATADSIIMQPPRLPLATLNVPNGSPLRSFVTNAKSEGGTAQKENASPHAQKAKAKKSDKPVKAVSEDLLPAFKAAISGSDLNKVALVEILKKQFPSCSKDAIKGTLESVAVRQGKKEIEKRWVLIV